MSKFFMSLWSDFNNAKNRPEKLLFYFKKIYFNS